MTTSPTTALVPLATTAASPMADQNGNVLANHAVFVYQPGTTTQVQVYDINGSPLSQPLMTSSLGYIPGFAYAEQVVDVLDQATGLRLANVQVLSAVDVNTLLAYIQGITQGAAIIAQVNVQSAPYNAVGNGVADDTAAIQAAIDYVRGLGLGGNSGSGVVLFPPTPTGYKISSALITHERIRLVGFQSYFGGTSVASKLIPDPGGNFTNGFTSEPFMIKCPAQWWHGGMVEHLVLDCQNVAVGGFRGIEPGENCGVFFSAVNDTGTINRTVSDAVFNGTTTITSATAAFTAEDVNGFITSTGTHIPADTKIDRIIDAQTAVTNNVCTTASGQSLTIKRPLDGVLFDGAAPTGIIDSLNGINNSGALLRLRNLHDGTWHIRSLSGDSNGGGLLRISNASQDVDVLSVTVYDLKAENYRNSTQDPVILLDNCDEMRLDIIGGSATNGQPNNLNARDLVRIDGFNSWRRPSLHLNGLEAANPFNTQYNNIVHDTYTGDIYPASDPFGSSYYPELFVNRDLVVLGSGRPHVMDNWHQFVPFLGRPSWESAALLWTTISQQGAPISYFLSLAVFNQSGAQNDGGGWNADLAKGTWDLTVLGTQSPNQAIITVDWAIAPPIPPAPTLQIPAGSMPAGNYGFCTTYQTALGESSPSPTVFQLVTGTQNIIVNPPVGIPGATGWNLYATSTGTMHRQGGLRSLSAGVTMSAAPTTTGALVPTANTAVAWNTIGTMDQYNATQQPSYWTFPGIVIPYHLGPIQTRFRALSRNASNTASPGYYMVLNGMDWARRT